jgi:hypothetical protein
MEARTARQREKRRERSKDGVRLMERRKERKRETP